MDYTDLDEIEDVEVPTLPDIDTEFWNLYTELVKLVYYTDPRDRLDVVKPELRHRYGDTQSEVYERIENHVLRTVAFIETFKKKDVLESP